MSATASARRRTACGVALSAALLGLAVPAPTAEAVPPGNSLESRCSTPAPDFDRTDYSVDGEPTSATTGDFNADDHPDVVAVTGGLGGYSAVVLRGDGQGAFPGKTTYNVEQDPADVVAADFDDDGYDDLAMSHTALAAPTFEVGRNNTTDDFELSTHHGNGTFALVPGDFDDDGKLDVAATANGGLEVWPGQGNGSFGSPQGYPTGRTSQGIAAGDFNGDGLLDVVTADRYDDTVSILLQTATGFAPATTVPVSDVPYAVTVADFDEDGNADIAVAKHYASQRISGDVELLLGDGAGGFDVGNRPRVYGDSNDIATGDFNHDGHVDLAVLNGLWNRVSVVSGNGDGSFGVSVDFPVGADARSVSVSDFDEDGLDDLLTANWAHASVSVLLNTSRPTNTDPIAEADSYTAPANGVLSIPATGVLGNDSDDDCDPLTASVATGPAHGVLDLDPDGSFTYTPTSGHLGADSFTYNAEDGLGGTTEASVQLNVTTVNAADDTATEVEGAAASPIDVLANDTDTDPAGGTLTITAVTQPAYGLVAITGGGSGLTYTPPSDATGPDPFTYTVTNGVGRTDTARVSVTVEPARGCAVADFAAPRQAGQWGLDYPQIFSTGDLDGDGDTDLAATGFDSNFVQFAHNDGSGAFPNVPDSDSTLTDPDGGSIADLNSDGRLDVALSGRTTRRIGVLYNTETGFPTGAVRYEYYELHLPASVVHGDVDEDGAMDVISSDGDWASLGDPGEALVWRGDGTGGFARQTKFGTPQTGYPSLADIDGDGHLDLVGSDPKTDRVWVMRGDGHAAFGSATFAAVGNRPIRQVTADFDGDGALDVATVNLGSRDLSVLYGDGGGGFAPAIQLPIGPTAGAGTTLVVADVNADGRADLITLQFSPGRVSVSLNRGTGGFAHRQVFSVSALSRTANVGDFNGDGSLDIAVSSNGGVIQVLDNQCTTRLRPTAVHDTYVTGEETELEVHTPGLLGNDIYGGAVTVSEQAGPSHGTLDLDPAGSFTYTPDADFFGRDSFTYQVDDGNGGTDTATVNLTVTPSQEGPDAVDDTLTVAQDAGATTVDVLADDTDADNDPLTVTGVTQGVHGTVAITNAGADVSYTPAAGYFGTDSFTYTISDGHGGTDTATVDVTVTQTPPPNQAPVATDDTLTVDQDSSATTVDVLANDIDADSDPLTVTGITQGAHGTVAITNAGDDVSYTPAAGYHGTDSFTYTVSDGHGGTDTATVNVTVTQAPPPNQAPVATDDTLTVAQDSSAATVDVLGNDTDADNDPLTVTGITQGAHGTVAITNAGDDVSYTPAAGYHGTDSFTYTVSDGHGGTDTATVNVTVTQAPPPNQAPVATDDTLTVAQDSSATTVDVLGNDTDADNDPLTVSGITQGAHGTVAITNAGADLTYTPAAGYFGTDSFTYTISDGHGGTDTATVNVTVTQTPPTNHDPVATNNTLTVAQDSSATTVDVLGDDTDADSDPLTVTGITQGAHGTVAITNAGADLSYTPAAGYFGTDSFTYTISDGHGGTDTATVNVTVTQTPPTNHDPVATDNTLTVAQDSSATTVDVLANDTDPDNDPLTVTGVTQGTHGTVAITNAGADLTYTPAAGYFGTDSFTYTVSDGHGGTDTATVNITITQTPQTPQTPPRDNHQPVGTDDTLTVAQDSRANTVDVLGNDTDADHNALTVTGVTQGAHGTVAITQGTHRTVAVTRAGADLTYTPAAGFHGTDSFTYTVSDGHGGTDTATVNVTVTQAPSELTVLSYDVGGSTAQPGHRWAQRRQAVADIIARSGAQVIGLQGTPHRERVGGRTVHPIADLRAGLPGFGLVGDDHRLRTPNVLLYRTSQFRALSSGTLRLSAGMKTSRRCPKVSPASATWAVLQNRDTQQRYFVVDTNLSRGDSCARQRTAETKKLKTLIRKANRTHAPVVLLGGLNADHDEPAPRLLDRRLDSTVPLSVATPTYNTGWDADRTNDTHRLDYVFHSPQLTLTRPGVIRRTYHLGGVRTSPSSHYAVRATFSSP